MPAPPARRGNILDGWGTFKTKLYAVLLHFTGCRKSRTINTVFKGNNLNFVTRINIFDSWVVQTAKKEAPRLPWFKDIIIIYCVHVYNIKILIKLYHKSWLTHSCRNFCKCKFYVFWGTCLTLNLCRGNTKALFSFLTYCKDKYFRFCWSIYKVNISEPKAICFLFHNHNPGKKIFKVNETWLKFYEKIRRKKQTCGNRADTLVI